MVDNSFVPSNSSIINKIEIKELFNTFSYTISPTVTSGFDSGRLLLLYGNNGSGKTTILKLLYHLLNPEPYEGHRHFISQLPFKEFSVELLDGIIIKAFRNKSAEPGDYILSAVNPLKNINIEWELPSERDLPGKHDKEYLAYCSFLEELDISFHFLQDTRRIGGSPKGRVSFRHRQEMAERMVLFSEEEEDKLLPRKQLEEAIEAAIQWFRKQALLASNIGYTSVNSIYGDIIKRIVTTPSDSEQVAELDIDQLKEKLTELRRKNSGFAKYGLTPELDIQYILDSLGAAQRQNVTMLNTVLNPYLNGHQARLDALQELQKVMDSFVSLIERFYTYKKLAVHINRGLQITTNTGYDLKPEMLSSGEKQLLLLLCNAISARAKKTLLVIDEPELSLNVAWQRELISALLTCLSGVTHQVILATHSIELLSQYREYVVPLQNKSEGY